MGLSGTILEVGGKLFVSRWNNGHRPLMRWGTEATDNPQVLHDIQQANPDSYHCIALKQSGLVVLDIDVKNGKDGKGSLFDLEVEHGDLPDTLTVETPSGGNHYFFIGECANTQGHLGEGIDTPVMVPFPGTVIEGKGEYRVVNQVEIAPLPEWINYLAGAPREKDPLRHIPAVDLDQKHNIEAAEDFLKSASPAIEGAGGDDHTYRIACFVRDYGISENKCLELILAHWNDRCEPPWDSEELTVKVENAYKYAVTRAGENLPEAQFQPVPVEDDDDWPRPFSFFQGAPSPREWIIEGWLPKGEITSLYGQGGAGKSLLALQLAMAVAYGGSWLDLTVGQQMPVFMVACEDSYNELHLRINDIRRSPVYDFLDYDDSLLIWSRAGLDAILAVSDRNRLTPGPFYRKLDVTLSHMPSGPKLLILDTLADFFAGSENDRAIVNYFIKVILGGLSRRHDATILLLGHPAKNDASEYSGSTAWNNAVRTRLTLSSHSNKNLDSYKVLTCSKSNYSKSGKEITLEWVKGRFDRVDGDNIIDEVGKANADILFRLITEQAEKGEPYGIYSASRPNILNTLVNDIDGKPMDKKTKKAYIDMMIVNGDVQLVKGMKKGGNGLYPVDAKEGAMTNVTS